MGASLPLQARPILLTAMQAPLIGRWSDRYGRRPFIAAFLVVASVPPFILAAHINYGLSLYYYFPAQASSPDAFLMQVWLASAGGASQAATSMISFSAPLS